MVRTPRPWLLPTQPCAKGVLVGSGVTEAMIRTQLASGRLLSLRRGVFLSAAAWPGDAAARHLVRARAELVANPDGVASHQSAAVAWALPAPGFGQWHEQPVSITLPPGHCSAVGTAVHHIGHLPATQVLGDAGGLAVTSPSRTAVDLADGLELPQALVLMDAAARLSIAGFVAAARRRDYANPRLVSAARELLRNAAAARGRSRLEPAIAATQPCRESAAESLSAGHLLLSGLPTPRFQAEIRTAAGPLFPDCLWDAQRLIGECDGAVKYTDAEGYVREKQREQVLRDLGYAFVRWQAKEIMLSPHVVIDRIARALDL